VDGSGELSEEELEKVVDWLLDITGEDLEVNTTAHHTPRLPASLLNCIYFPLLCSGPYSARTRTWSSVSS